jgi:plastocyanin
VSLTSSNTAAANVPASVTIAAGATTATFAATTSSVAASTPVTITASYSSVTRTATLTVNPSGQSATLTVTATGRSGERVTSTPTGINVSVGTTGSAPFTTGTSITLQVTNSRDAIWSGACSSGGNKTKTCTFTLNGNATVNANVQ